MFISATGTGSLGSGDRFTGKFGGERVKSADLWTHAAKPENRDAGEKPTASETAMIKLHVQDKITNQGIRERLKKIQLSNRI